MNAISQADHDINQQGLTTGEVGEGVCAAIFPAGMVSECPYAILPRSAV